MPWCQNCYKPIQLSGLCPPCEKETAGPPPEFPFVDDDEVTEVGGYQAPTVDETAYEQICGACMGTGDWFGPNDLIACPGCLGTGRAP